MAARTFGKDAQSESKKASERAFAEVQNSPTWEAPDESEWDQEDPVPVYRSKRSRTISRTAFYRGKIVDFAIMHEIMIEGEWKQVFRSDCHLGVVHRHTGLPAREHIKENVLWIKSQDDVNDSFESEYSFMLDTCTERETRWDA